MKTPLDPVDRTAAIILSRGVRVDYKKARILPGPPPPTGIKPPTLPNMPHYTDMTGRKLEHCEVVRLHNYNWNRPRGRRIQYLCKCRCGNHFLCYRHRLKGARCGECWELYNKLNPKTVDNIK